MDSYIIQVQPQDELTVIVDKVIHTQAPRVYLLVPEGSRLSQHVLNFRLLKREADALRKEIVVVSSSARVQSLALKASLEVHQETSELRRGAALGSHEITSFPTKLADIVAPASPKTPITPQERKVISFWTKRPSFDARNRLIALPRHAHRLVSGVRLPVLHWSFTKIFRMVLWALVGVSFGAAALTFYLVLPSAKVYIKPVVEEVKREMSIRGSAHISQADSADRVLPVQIFERSLEDSRTVASSGERDVKEKAQGLMRVYNAYSSAPQTLVAATRFVSENGKLFRTKETIVVRGAEVDGGKIAPSFTEVNVVASEAGEEYNIGPSTFSIPGFKGTDKYLGFYGKSVSNMEGGRIGRVKTVTEEDYAKTKVELVRSLENRVEEDLTVAIPEGFFIIPGARHVADVVISSTGEPGDIVGEFRMSGSVLSKAFAARRNDVERLLEQDFVEKFPGKKRIPREDGVTYQVRKLDFEGGVFEIYVSLSEKASEVINETLVRAEIRGKDEGKVRAFLSSHPNIKEARVTFWPFWVSKIPDDIGKLEIIIE